ncbi:MFS transporter-like protein [Mytilinidion resinicola]|uniref:MFS transporter-like protein n=1 Tax=Mytilinidion resinicola TaxID=574789 RepID=A0A6A6YCX2_9PEZI|nr:MFS transporter-like protein [Mytilinidion resinicola]KAF2806449.1 MFS transporter-like protein [Mytilinidion resinicola]
MGWGVLQDPLMENPPGTATIGASPVIGQEIYWSPLWKNTIMVILAFSSGLTTALGPMLTPGLHTIAVQYNVSLDMVSSFMIGFFAFWIGSTTFFTAAGANIWGKRPFFLISTVILIGTCVWGYLASSFQSLAAMRVVQGMASAPLETLVTSSVSDLFFVHQRGSRLAIWGVMLASGVLLGQTISGYIIQTLGIRSTFAIAGMIFIFLLPLTYFFVLETTFTSPRERTAQLQEKGNSFWMIEHDGREPYRRQLRVFRGRLSPESYWKGVIKPFPLIAYPAVLFSTIVYGSFFTWLLVISLLSATAFGSPPYNLTPSQIGLTNLPLFGVALLGSPLSGWMADTVAKGMARRNRGVFEPEFRLTLMLVAMPLSTIGFLGFGTSVHNHAPLAWPLVFMSLHALSVPFATQASLTYVIDCHPRDANQAFVTINFAKAVFTFLATTYVNGWYLRVGPRQVFYVIAAVNLGVCTLTGPAYVFGKRFRGMVARSRFAQKLSG